MAAMINADFVNSFLIASTRVLKDACGIEAKVGKPYVRENEYTDDQFLIMVGVVGEISGQVIYCFPVPVALEIATKMCGGIMEMTEMNDISRSAICELCNMMLGNTATVFSTKSIAIDITPPTMCTGTMKFFADKVSNICIPLSFETDKAIEINVAIKDGQ